MPRSPSPYRRYRDDSPRRYRDERDRDWDRDRGYGDYRGPRREYRDSRDFRNDRRGWDDRPSYSRDRSPAYSNDRRSPLPASSKGSPGKPASTPNLTVRSGTPEEGQITSPKQSSSGRLPSKPVPLPARSPRPRSPSPLPRWNDRPYRRESWGGRERDFRGRSWRDDRRDSDRPGDRDRDRDYRYNRGDDRRSPRSPRGHRRSPSRSTRSSRSPSRSSRFASPRKRSPERVPPPRGYASPLRPSVLEDEKREDRSPPPSVPEKKPSFVTSRPPPTAPSGPRSERVPPTGPRALSGGYIRPPPPSAGPSAVATQAAAKVEGAISPARPPVVEERINPYKTSGPPSAGSGRLSWAERKPGLPDVHPPPSVPGNEEIKREVDVVAPIPIKIEPAHAVAEIKAEPDDSAEQRRAHEAEMRILMEIQTIPNKYGTAQWELDLEAHYAVMQNLAAQTAKFQSGARIAGAVLADAEAERVMMGQRRKAADKLLADDWDALGIPGVSS